MLKIAAKKSQILNYTNSAVSEKNASLRIIKKANVKLNITPIVRMPGKMRAALNQFSYDIMKIRVGEAPKKNLFNIRKNLYNSGYFEGGFRGKCLQCLFP